MDSIWTKTARLATHFPLLNKHGGYFLKLYQHRSYVLALENVPGVQGMYVDENKRGLFFRNYGGMLLLGGGGHRTGKERFACRDYPGAPITARWATQDCMTLDGAPYIGPYSKSTDGLYVATGFNKWGMTSSMAAASLLTDLVLERKNPYGELFSPSRTVLRPQLAANSLESALGILPPPPPVPPHGLRSEIQCRRAQLGLPLPRLPLRRGRDPHRQPGHRRQTEDVIPCQTA